MKNHAKIVLIALQWVMLLAVIAGLLTFIGILGATVVAGVTGTTLIADPIMAVFAAAILTCASTLVMLLLGDASEHIL